MDSLIVSNVPNYQALLDSVFSEFLTHKKVSEKTRKNYLSDIRRFIIWIINKNTSILTPSQRPWLNQEHVLKAILGTITAENLEYYKQDLFALQTPASTINRHLSAIRLFCQCALEQSWIDTNPTIQIKNISSVTNLLTNESVLESFKKFLTDDGASKTTVNNYVTDAAEFLNWIDSEAKLELIEH